MTRYIRQEEIGRGSFGVVYKAFEAMTGDIVAIKVLGESAGQPKREIFVSRRIAHRNVCPIFGHFEDEDGYNCIVMEFVDGGNLQTLLQQAAPLPLDRALAIATQILDGLEASHRAEIVHLDLKPANILLTSNGTVKLSDFGHARPMGTKPSRESLSQLGTPAYMAPEQAMGEECDARTDIFAFGRILREMLGDNVPSHIQAAINGCLKKDPSDRFASISEVRAALSGHIRKPRLAAVLAVSAITLLLAIIPLWSRHKRHHDGAADMFSDGVYFFQNGLAADALQRFDAVLSIDDKYPGAHYYRGLALEKLNKLDEAIDAFKHALPRAEPERRILWSWDAPASLDASPYPARPPAAAAGHGIIRGMDNIQVNFQRDFIESRKDVVLQNAVIYAEHKPMATVLHFLDLEQHQDRRVEIPDEQTALDTTAKANGSFTIIQAKSRFYGFSADGTLLWHKDLAEYGSGPLKSALIGGTFYVYSAELQRFDLLDARTAQLLWRRDAFAIESFQPPMVRRDLLIVKSGNTYRAIRQLDGKVAWTVHVQSEKASSLADDRRFIVFEPEKRIFTVDLETGRTLSEVKLEQYYDALPFRPRGYIWLVGALLEGETLYLMSKDLELVALSINPLRILWHTPISKKMQAIRVHGSHLYLGTDDGELIVLDAVSGAITTTTKLTSKPLLIDYAGGDAVVVGSNNTLYGLNPLGAKQWEYPSVDPLAEATYFNGTVTAYTSPQQLSSLDVVTGKVLWQYSSARKPYVFLNARSASATARSRNDGRFFIVEENGVKEYEIHPAVHSVTDKESLTELARAYQAKGDLAQARVFIDKAGEIDPNYPPLEFLRSRLSKAQGRAAEAARELAHYASLVGLDSNEGKSAISELKRDHVLLWETAITADVAGDPVIIENRLVSVGRRVGHEAVIVALDSHSGEVVWSYSGERYLASLADPPFVWYVSSSQADGTLVNLYRIDVRSGERQQIETRHNPTRVDQAWIALNSGQPRIITEPPPESKTNPMPPQAALWPPSAFTVQNGCLYAYTADGHAYAMALINN